MDRSAAPAELGREGECTAFSFLALHLEVSAHQRHQVIADCQAEARTAVPSGGRAIGLPERLENHLAFVLGNSDAGIAKRRTMPLAGWRGVLSSQETRR